jgi:dihydropteroate synthase
VPPRLRARDLVVDLGDARPWLMGIVNTSPDSFSDAGQAGGAERGVALLEAGADVLDVGGESAVTGRPPVPAEQEIERVVPVIAALAERGAVVSVDTYKPQVARAALEAGASIVNDVSGLRDPELADVCASTGAALVVMHTNAAPKERMQDPDAYGDVTGEVVAFLRSRMEEAVARGVDPEQIVLDPGPDFAKTPAQTVELLRGLRGVLALGRPVLLAISRKDFVGAITGRSPARRGAGTLAALGYGADAGAHMFRVHDIAAARDFLAVRAALRGESDLPGALPDALRHEPPPG